MARITLKDDEYTFNASARTITLATPYNALNQGQIVSIFNLTTHDQIFDVVRRKHTISLSGAVVTHTYDNTQHNDTDKLQIVIETELSFTDVDNVLFENQSIPAGEIIDSNWLNIEGINSLNLYVSSVLSFTWYVQFADDPATNPDGFDSCNASGTAYSYSTLANKKCIPITDIKASQVRVLAKNNGASAEAPYCGVK